MSLNILEILLILIKKFFVEEILYIDFIGFSYYSGCEYKYEKDSFSY